MPRAKRCLILYRFDTITTDRKKSISSMKVLMAELKVIHQASDQLAARSGACSQIFEIYTGCHFRKMTIHFPGNVEKIFLKYFLEEILRNKILKFKF